MIDSNYGGVIKVKRGKKAPRASKKSKNTKKRYEEKLTIWFTISIFLIVLIALVIFFINKIETTNQVDIVAEVNGFKITEEELDNWYKISVKPEFREVITKENFLSESLIPQKILLQKAEKENINVDEDEVETAIGEFLIESGINSKDFEKELKEDGTNMDFVKESFRQRIIILKFINEYFLSNIEVSDLEIEEIFENTKSLDPDLSEEEIKEIIGEQLLLGKQNDALKVFMDDLTNDAEIELFALDKDVVSFSETKDEICLDKGKPIIRLYTISTCKPCQWISESFEKVVKSYVEDETIIAYHWILDSGDNALTKKIENGIPKKELEIFKKYNSETTVPTFIFGCKYVRVGNFYEEEDNLGAEEEEFRTVIDKLLKS